MRLGPVPDRNGRVVVPRGPTKRHEHDVHVGRLDDWSNVRTGTLALCCCRRWVVWAPSWDGEGARWRLPSWWDRRARHAVRELRRYGHLRPAHPKPYTPLPPPGRAGVSTPDFDG